MSQVFSTDVHKIHDTALSILPTDNDLLKSNAFIGFTGVFSISLSLFVLAYISFQCLRKTDLASGSNGNERQAQYKSLRFETVDLGTVVYSELQEQINFESSHLSPVSSHIDDRNESQDFSKNETRFENYVNLRSNQELARTENESNISLVDQTEHVYIEITKDNI